MRRFGCGPRPVVLCRLLSDRTVVREAPLGLLVETLWPSHTLGCRLAGPVLDRWRASGRAGIEHDVHPLEHVLCMDSGL